MSLVNELAAVPDHNATVLQFVYAVQSTNCVHSFAFICFVCEGRQRAMARGVRMGCKPRLTGHQHRGAIARREAGEVLTDIAKSYNVSHSTISRL